MMDIKKYIIERIKTFECKSGVNWEDYPIEMLMARLRVLERCYVDG